MDLRETRSVACNCFVLICIFQPALTAAEKPSSSFGVPPASYVAVANSAESSLLLRQMSSVFTLFVQVSASLALRLLARIGNGALPVNKSFQRDEFVVSHLLQRAQKLRHNNFAPEQGR